MDQYGTLHLLVMEVASNNLGQDGISNNLQHWVPMSSNPSCQGQPSINISEGKCLNQSWCPIFCLCNFQHITKSWIIFPSKKLNQFQFLTHLWIVRLIHMAQMTMTLNLEALLQHEMLDPTYHHPCHLTMVKQLCNWCQMHCFQAGNQTTRIQHWIQC